MTDILYFAAMRLYFSKIEASSFQDDCTAVETNGRVVSTVNHRWRHCHPTLASTLLSLRLKQPVLGVKQVRSRRERDGGRAFWHTTVLGHMQRLLSSIEQDHIRLSMSVDIVAGSFAASQPGAPERSITSDEDMTRERNVLRSENACNINC